MLWFIIQTLGSRVRILTSVLLSWSGLIPCARSPTKRLNVVYFHRHAEQRQATAEEYFLLFFRFSCTVFVAGHVAVGSARK
jgi:hypothetical protein